MKHLFALSCLLLTSMVLATEQAPRPPQAPCCKIPQAPERPSLCGCSTTGLCVCGNGCQCPACEPYRRQPAYQARPFQQPVYHYQPQQMQPARGFSRGSC